MSLAALMAVSTWTARSRSRDLVSGSVEESAVIDQQCLPQAQKRRVMGQQAAPLLSLLKALLSVLLGAGAERL